MYADTITGSMKRAIDETNRRRKIQIEYNEEHGITPQTIVKSVRDVIEIGTHAESGKKGNSRKVLNRSENAAILTDEERNALIQELSAEMMTAAAALDFERAAYLRDKIETIRIKNKDKP